MGVVTQGNHENWYVSICLSNDPRFVFMFLWSFCGFGLLGCWWICCEFECVRVGVVSLLNVCLFCFCLLGGGSGFEQVDDEVREWLQCGDCV